MPRIAQGIRITLPKGERRYRCVFTCNGKQVNRSTGILAREHGGEPDAKRRAYEWAKRLELELLTGERSSSAEAAKADIATAGTDLKGLVRDWLVAAEGASLSLATTKDYATRFRAHLVPWFKTLENVNHERAKGFIAARLQHVKAKTVSRDLSALRSLLAHLGWDEARINAHVPLMSRKGAKGTAHPKGRRTATQLTQAEALAMLKLLPAKDRLGRLLRARYAVAYETSLRPRTIAELEVPAHWVAGATHLRIFDRLDKKGFGRRVPLSRRARLWLHLATQGGKRQGLIFGPGVNRKVLKAAARAVLGPWGSTFQPYDFRRNRLTHWIDDGAPLTAVQWSAGHTRVSTTAIYVMPGEKAAEAMHAARRPKRSNAAI